MLEDLGQCKGNKISEALVQSDTLGEGLSNQNSDNNQSLSLKFWDNVLENAIKDLKQFETGNRIEEPRKTVQDSKPGLIKSAETDQGLERILDRETVAALIKQMLQEKPIERSDCGFDKAFERQGKAETDESIRRLGKIDLRPFLGNQFDSRR